MHEAPDSNGIAERSHAEVHRAVAMRIGLLTAVWIVARGVTPGSSELLKLALDSALALVSWLILDDGFTHGGIEFGRNNHWTKLLLGPLVLGTVLAVLGLWRIFRAVG